MSFDKVPNSSKELMEKIKAVLAFDDANHSEQKEVTDLFVECLDDDMDLATAKRYQGKFQDFGNAVVHATGEVGILKMKANADIDRVTVNANIGFDEIRVSVDRKVDVRNPQTGEIKPKFGSVSVKYVTAAGQKRGVLKHIMEGINEMGTAHLSS